MDLTITSGTGAGAETPEQPEVGIPNYDETIHYWKIPPTPALKYRECLRNHAASIGGHAVDGCGEFLPSPATTPSDPKTLECAVCNCHRNFHRREDDDSVATTAQFLSFRRRPTPIPLPPPPHILFAIRSGAPEDQGTVLNAYQPAAENLNGRKRHRTKFSGDQKEKMLCFAERIGWKIQKSDEFAVDEFCKEIGVGKGVFKVWMHNNKHINKGKEKSNLGSGDITTAAATIAGRDNSEIL